jgi:hypothetical protein
MTADDVHGPLAPAREWRDTVEELTGALHIPVGSSAVARFEDAAGGRAYSFRRDQ